MILSSREFNKRYAHSRSRPAGECCAELLAKSTTSQTLSQPRIGSAGWSQDCHGVAPAATLLVLLLLSACSHPASQQVTMQPIVIPPPPVTEPVAAPAPRPPRIRYKAAVTKVTVTPPPAAPPSPSPPASSGGKIPELVGLSEPAVVSQMGKPDDIAAEGAGQALIWRSGPCELRVTFFLDVTRNQYFALSQELSEATCVERIAARVPTS